MEAIKNIVFTLLILSAGNPKAVWTQITNPEREFLFAQKLYEDQLFSLASQQFEAFANRFPNSEHADDALFLSGESYYAISDFNNGFEVLKELELSYPQSTYLPRARFLLARCQLGLQDFAAAGELFKRVAYFHPQSDVTAAALLEAGRAFKRSNDLQAALTALVQLTRDYPDSPQRIEADLEIVDAFVANGDLSEAVARIDGILRVFGPDIKDPRVYWMRGQIFEKLGQTQEAEAIYLKLAQDFDTSPQARLANYRLAEIYQKKGDYERALQQYDLFLSVETDATLKASAYLRKGDLLFDTRNYEAALSHYRQADSLGAASHRQEISFKRAQALLALHDLEAAATTLQGMVENSVRAADELEAERRGDDTSDFVEAAYCALIETRVELGQPRSALRRIKEYEVNFPAGSKLEWMAFQTAAILEAELHDFTRAQRAYERFMEVYPGSPMVDEAQFGLAQCYLRLREYRLAQHEFDKYLRRYPGGDTYEAAAARQEIIEETVNPGSGTELREVSVLLAQIARNEKPRSLEFELGKIYLKTKNYEQAIATCKAILANNDNDDIRADVYYILGKSYFQAAERAKLHEDSVLTRTYYDSAAISLRFASEILPDHAEAEELAYLQARARLATQDSAARQERLQRLLAWPLKFPGGKHLDFAWLEIAEHHFRTANENDTTGLDSARIYYDRILSEKPTSALAEKAMFGRVLCSSRLEADSVSLAQIDTFTAHYPRSHFVPQLLLVRAEINRRAGDLAAARRDLGRVHAEYFYSPQAQEAKRRLAELEFEAGDFRSALDLYNRIELDLLGAGHAAPDTDAGIVPFRQAMALERLGLHSHALRRYLKFIDRQPQSPEAVQARMAIARIAEQQGNLTFAMQFYERILAQSTTDDDKYAANMAIGDLLFKQRSYQDALAHYTAARAATLEPARQRRAESQVIRCKYKMRQFAAADADVKQFKKRFEGTAQEEAQFLLEKANAYKTNKNFEFARKAFKKLKKDYKNTEWAAQGEFGLGAVDLITNHTEEALEILTDIPLRYPDSAVTPLAYFNLGDFYYKSQQVENAIHAFKKTLEHQKAGEYHSKALLYLIDCYRDASLWDQAIARTREYLRKYPESEHAFRKKIDLAQLLMKVKEYNRAIDQLELLLPYAPDEFEAEIQFYIAQCYKEMGDFTRATAEFLKVKYLTQPSKLPWHVTALFETGRCFLKLKEVEQAKKIFRRIVREQGTGSNFGRFAVKQLQELESNHTATSSNGDLPPR
ncbi:MAG: tetratricopeptide repeat protein [bacterium]